jgi:hypothetical protein
MCSAEIGMGGTVFLAGEVGDDKAASPLVEILIPKPPPGDYWTIEVE